MQREQHTSTHDSIPACGFRARRWARFERDLAQWLSTPEGRFAQWRAAHAIVAPATPHDA